ncbi:hypothetical protein LIA77_10533 [Sarocladium implicatum]|nr:hypothetical protein LIA77_10533 [Sarocladium implicatum]
MLKSLPTTYCLVRLSLCDTYLWPATWLNSNVEMFVRPPGAILAHIEMSEEWSAKSHSDPRPSYLA